MKTTLQKQLLEIAPSVAIETIWSHDTYASHDIFEPGNALDDQNPDNWQAWESEVRVTAISNGSVVTASDYLGGTWEPADKHPKESNPDISGYELQLTGQALEELRGLVTCTPLETETRAAIAYCKREMRAVWDAQQKQHAAA